MSVNSITDWSTWTPATAVGKSYAYIDLPVFSYSSDLDWKGASEIATQFNYAASQQFVLRNRPAKPAGVNYCLCVSYRVGNTVYRWKLWENAGEVLNVPLYGGQVIQPNFVLEVWTVLNVTIVTNAAALRLFSGVVIIPTDLRSEDTALATGVEYPKSVVQFSFVELQPETNLLWARYRADSATLGGVPVVATGALDGITDTGLGNNSLADGSASGTWYSSNTGVNNKPVIGPGLFSKVVSLANTAKVKELWMVLTMNGWTANNYILTFDATVPLNIRQLGATPNIRVTYGTGVANLGAGLITINDGVFFTLRITYSSDDTFSFYLYAIDGTQLGAVENTAIGSTPTNVSGIYFPFTSGPAAMYVAEILLYSQEFGSAQQITNNKEYIKSRYIEPVFSMPSAITGTGGDNS